MNDMIRSEMQTIEKTPSRCDSNTTVTALATYRAKTRNFEVELANVDITWCFQMIQARPGIEILSESRAKKSCFRIPIGLRFKTGRTVYYLLKTRIGVVVV